MNRDYLVVYWFKPDSSSESWGVGNTVVTTSDKLVFQTIRTIEKELKEQLNLQSVVVINLTQLEV